MAERWELHVFSAKEEWPDLHAPMNHRLLTEAEAESHKTRTALLVSVVKENPGKLVRIVRVIEIRECNLQGAGG